MKSPHKYLVSGSLIFLILILIPASLITSLMMTSAMSYPLTPSGGADGGRISVLFRQILENDDFLFTDGLVSRAKISESAKTAEWLKSPSGTITLKANATQNLLEFGLNNSTIGFFGQPSGEVQNIFTIRGKARSYATTDSDQSDTLVTKGYVDAKVSNGSTTTVTTVMNQSYIVPDASYTQVLKYNRAPNQTYIDMIPVSDRPIVSVSMVSNADDWGGCTITFPNLSWSIPMETSGGWKSNPSLERQAINILPGNTYLPARTQMRVEGRANNDNGPWGIYCRVSVKYANFFTTQ